MEKNKLKELCDYAEKNYWRTRDNFENALADGDINDTAYWDGEMSAYQQMWAKIRDIMEEEN